MEPKIANPKGCSTNNCDIEKCQNTPTEIVEVDGKNHNVCKPCLDKKIKEGEWQIQQG